MRKSDKKEDLKVISVECLEPSALNTYEVGDTSDLEWSILSHGVLTPLTVIGPSEDGKYSILAGERRYRSVIKLNEEGKTSITGLSCKIIGPYDMSDLEQKLIIETSNLETRDFDKNEHRFQVIGILKQMADNGDIKYKDIVKQSERYLKVSDRYGRMYLQIFETGTDELKELIKNNKITIADASKVSNMNEDEQKEIIDRINAGEKAKDVIKPESKKPKKSEEPKIDYDDDFIADFMDDENYPDMSPDDKMSLFDNYASGLSLSCDTTGEIRKMENENEEEYNNFVKKITRWTNKMKKKTEYTEEELEVIESLRELIIHVDEMSLV